MNALDIVTISSERAAKNPLDYVNLTVPQRTFVSCNDNEALWRDGNQLGKSFALAWDIHHRCRGTHPYVVCRRRPPIKVLVISVSYDQMMPLMEKLWDLAPKGEIDPDNGFEPGRGITGKPPRLVYVSGPGKGSVITFATYKAGATRVAGGTYDLVVMDEPPPESMYGEVRPRILRRRGLLRIGMTPTPDMPDVSWLRKIAVGGSQALEPGQVREFNFGLTEANLLPPNYPRPFLDQAEIDAFEAGLLAHEKEMRMRGAWEPVVTGRWLTAFLENVIVQPVNLARLPGWKLTVGMDHGTADGKQCAMLVASKHSDTPRPLMRWAGESVNEGFTAPEDDARGIYDMLQSRGLTYWNIDEWIGDVPATSDVQDIIKSNDEIKRELAKLYGIPLKKMKRITYPQKSARSMQTGLRTMNTIFSRRSTDDTPDGIVDPSCVRFIEACRTFAGDRKDPVKDVLDAGRYAMEKSITVRLEDVLNVKYM